MANLQHRLPENVPGDFFVDSSCIDCDTCSRLAPGIFHDHGEQCSVHHQPENDEETRMAMMALVACPTGSIGSTQGHDAHLGIDAFPLHISEDVYFCGFTAEDSFGGWSYLIKRPQGNILVDSPRFATQLVKRIAAMGGVEEMLLTHKDDIAAHKSFAERFGTSRTMHRDDGAVRLGIEHVIEGETPVKLDPDLLAIPTPGHTRGHVVFLYKEKYLFTGDHLAWSPARQTLTAFRSVAWYSWPEQIRSMERLLTYDFQWVLPGHGDMHQDSAEKMREHLGALYQLDENALNPGELTMTKNGKIALGCGGAGCLGLIVLVIAGVIIYLVWMKPAVTNRNYNFNVSNSNRNSNSNSDANSNANSNSNQVTNSSNSTSSTGSMSDDDKHKLYQAALTTGDSELVRRVSVKLGLMNEDFTPGDDYTEFVKDHAIWVIQNTDFLQTMNSKEKAVAYVNEHMP